MSSSRARMLHLLVLLGLGWSLCLGLLDHHAVEWDPHHGHVVVGGTAEQRALALEAHSHGPHEPHSHPGESSGAEQATSEAQGSHVAAVPMADALSSLAFGLGGQAIAAPLSMALVLLLMYVGRVRHARLACTAVPVPIAKPPPRSSL